ncbi:TonB-dependent receptor [Chromatium okenii]|uniref:TonB-dependent receptor plug domain-containing protein n=1 Tax=Chromatium okenii TaxID=61644 RepID=UPI0019078ECE|nr:TonB-dependent receptor [Chromatium okenii]MBK1642807.1 TonB-dependent receptor [Chromatium okenii]
MAIDITKHPHRAISRQFKHVIALALLGGAMSAAADDAALPIYDLGVINVTATAPAQSAATGADQVASIVTLDDMRQFNRDNVGDALDLLPGVTVTTNSRNEKTVFVRGFDARQVPLFIDGIPIYVPYDGYIDFNRFSTADLSAIQIAKGFSSVIYGANTLGGAINLISRQPRATLEGDVSVGFGDGNERTTSVNVGSNQGLWYVQAGAGWSDGDELRLAQDFKPTAIEDGAARDNSAHTDDKVSLKVGLTPNATDNYALSYSQQNGEKEQPPSTDPAAARYWQWPTWDKKSLYFISNTALGEAEIIKLRLYQDQYDNAVKSYTDDTYTQLKTAGKGSVGIAGESVYNDRSLGGSIELRSTRLSQHDLGLSIQRKLDEHRADDTIQRTEHFEDTLTSVGLEDNIKLIKDLTLSLGVAWSELQADTVEKLTDAVPLPDAQSATNGQAGLFWDVAPNGRLYATVATKTRFPTLKDRYSLRLGTAIPNPALESEHSINYEIGYQGTPWAGIRLETALFVSDITDLIQQVNNVVPGKYQMQNVGEVRSTGVEIGVTAPLGTRWEVGSNLTLLDRDNRSAPNTRLTGVPDRKLTAHARFRPADRWEALLFIEHEGRRWDSQTVELDNYVTANFKLAYQPMKAVVLEARVNNLADANYALADGFPNPGRMWFLNARYEF